MANLADIHFAELLPPSLQADANMQAIAGALDGQLRALVAALPKAAILPDIASLPESILDQLAGALDVLDYQQSYSLEQKIALVAGAVVVHRHRGTPAAIHDIVTAIFGEGMTLQEWFDYGGAPYHFRLIGSEGFSGIAQQAAWIAAVKATKNTRSILDAIVTTVAETSTIYAGCIVHIGAHQTFTQGA